MVEAADIDEAQGCFDPESGLEPKHIDDELHDEDEREIKEIVPWPTAAPADAVAYAHIAAAAATSAFLDNADVVVEEAATSVYFDEDGSVWVKAWVRVPDLSVAGHEGLEIDVP